MKITLEDNHVPQAIFLGMRLAKCTSIEQAEKASDSFAPWQNCKSYDLGERDLKLCKALIMADINNNSNSHAKYLRLFHVQASVIAPLYWWKEYDTYKVATTTLSSSTMHTLQKEPITIDNFELDNKESIKESFISNNVQENADTSKYPFWQMLIEHLETLRKKYNETGDKKYWRELIQALPESWIQARVIDLDYQTLRNIYNDRKDHKLIEWRKFCKWIEESLHFSKELILYKGATK